MSIPRIASYAMPAGDELAETGDALDIDPARALLLIHDMQRYFLAPFDRAAEPIPQLLANIVRLRAACADAGVPVVFSAQPGDQTPEQRGLLTTFWGPGMRAVEDHTAIVPELAPAPEDTLITKWRYSALVRTGLLDLLRGDGRDQVLVCGVYAHLGCLMTACHAFMEDVQPFFVADGVADFSREEHLAALRYAARRCAVVASTDRLSAALSASAPAPARPASLRA